MNTQDTVDKHSTDKHVALVDIHRSHQRLEGVTADRLESARRVVLILDEVEQADSLRQLVETDATHNLRAQLGEETLALVGIFLVEEFRHNSAKHSVAKILQTLVVDAVAVVDRRKRAVGQRNTI